MIRIGMLRRFADGEKVAVGDQGGGGHGGQHGR